MLLNVSGRRTRAGVSLSGRLAALLVTAALSVSTIVQSQPAHDSAAAGEGGSRMSFSNRVLLNRATVAAFETVELMLAVVPGATDRVAARVGRLGGRVERTEEAIAYQRVELPSSKVVELAADRDVVAYQISTLSGSTWYRDGPPESNARSLRRIELSSGAAAPPPPAKFPLLTKAASDARGYTAEDDSGVGEWLAAHPTFDGRGVTIAIMENGNADYSHPAFRDVTALDGTKVPKIAGILNAMDPDGHDDTRVSLDVELKTARRWVRVKDRLWVTPRAGTFRLGIYERRAGSPLYHHFGILEDVTSKELWVDTDGDLDFSDETPIADVNERVDVRRLQLVHPRKETIDFVIARGQRPHTVHIYQATSGHQNMTLSVAAGSRNGDSLAYGVAPGARLLVVRTGNAIPSLRGAVEGYIDVAKRADVDVIGAANNLLMVPDTAGDLLGVLFTRLVDTYDKPIFISSGNRWLKLSNAAAAGSAFTVGGSIGPNTFAAFFGGSPLDRLILHPVTATGPTIDGVLKPDFLAPVHRIAAGVKTSVRVDMPLNAPTASLPDGYEVSCCTSASAPYAAGLAALIVSAAKQTGQKVSTATLGRALRAGATFLPHTPASQQGAGVLNVNGAWKAFKADVELPTIQVKARVVHPLAPYARRGDQSQGLFELDGWRPGDSATRTVTFRRISGSREAQVYNVAWIGNTGTFDARRAVRLPLDVNVPLAIAIRPKTAGLHSAILTLQDPQGVTVLRSPATIVASTRLDAATPVLTFTGSVSLMRAETHYFDVAPDGGSLVVELDVRAGTVWADIHANHGLGSAYYGHVQPMIGSTFVKGLHKVMLPRPAAGTWAVSIQNVPASDNNPEQPASTDTAAYALTTRWLSSTLSASRIANGTTELVMQPRGAPLREPVVQTSVGTRHVHQGRTPPTGLPALVDIDVTEGTALLDLRLRGTGGTPAPLDLHLYDCTSGECFVDNFTLPARPSQTLFVRKPNAGRWVAAISPAPFPDRVSPFELEVVVAKATDRISGRATQAKGKGRAPSQIIPAAACPARDAQAVCHIELIDAALERELAAHPWETRKGVPNVRDLVPVAGSVVVSSR